MAKRPNRQLAGSVDGTGATGHDFVEYRIPSGDEAQYRAARLWP
jgi:hypothetical protein